MVAGKLRSRSSIPGWPSMFVVWVAIAGSGVSWIHEGDSGSSRDFLLKQKFKQQVPHVPGSPTAIFAHPHERGPVPGPENRKKYHCGQVELPVGADEPVEIGQLLMDSVTDAFDAIKRDL